MGDIAETQETLRRLAIESYRDEFRDLSETWRAHDTKAQGIGTIAGIFLAAVFTWARTPPANLGTWGRLAITLSAIGLIAAVVCAVLALRVRKVANPPHGQQTGTQISDILGQLSKEEMPQRLEALAKQQMGAWQRANASMRAEAEKKGKHIDRGQIALLVSAGLVAVTAGFSIWIKAETGTP